MRINIYVPDYQLRDIDEYCENNGMKRSTFLIRSALEKIENNDGFKYKKVEKKINAIKTQQEAREVIESKFTGLCPHGSMKGLCKKGC